MPVFQYTALNEDGSEMDGIVEADSGLEARSKLRDRGLHVKEVEAVLEETDESEEWSLRRMFSRRSTSELVTFTRQISTLLRAGVPLADALSAMIEQTDSSLLENVLRDIREQVTQGETFAEALSAHPDWFDNLYTAMVRAGEESGQLDHVLQKLGEYLRSQSQLRRRIIGALTYPAFVLVAGIGVGIFLLTFVLPKILNLLEQGGEALPLPTQILIVTSEFLQGYWPVLLVLAGGIVVLWKLVLSTEKGRYAFDLFLLNTPILGTFLKKAALSRFASTLATLLDSGLSVMDALEVVEDVLNNAVLAETIRDTREQIMSGARMSETIRDAPYFPASLAYMIGVGEESGQLEDLLETVSDAYDDELRVAAEQFTSLLEPVMIIFIAGGVFFVAMALLMPLMQMNQL